MAARLPRDRPRQTQARPDRVPQQRRRSPEPDCPRSIQSSRHSGNSVLCPRSVPSTKRLIRSLRKSRRESYCENQIASDVFTQPGSLASLSRCLRYVCFPPNCDHSGRLGTSVSGRDWKFFRIKQVTSPVSTTRCQTDCSAGCARAKMRRRGGWDTAANDPLRIYSRVGHIGRWAIARGLYERLNGPRPTGVEPHAGR